MNPGLTVTAAVLSLTGFAIYREVKKARAQKRAHQDRLDAASEALGAFAADHELETGSPSVDVVRKYSFWATSAESVRMAKGSLCGRRACLLTHAGGMPELAVLVECPDIPNGVSLAPAPTGPGERLWRHAIRLIENGIGEEVLASSEAI